MKISAVLGIGLIPLLLILFIRGAEYAARIRYNVPEPGAAVLITGARRGLGLSAAKRLVKEGFHVFVNVRREEDAEQVRKMNIPNLEPIVFDLKDDAGIVRAEKTIREWSKKTKKPFAALINSAVHMDNGLFEVWTPAQVDAFVAINFRALIIVTSTFIPLLRESKGRIINVSSAFANTFPPGMNHYSGAKAYMDAMTTGLRIELAPVGIACINIKPAFMATELVADMNKYLDQILDTLFPSEYRAMYKVDIPKLRKDFLAFTENAGPLSAYDDAVADAMKNPKPQTLYSVGTLHGIPDPAIVIFLSDHLPESVFQLLLSAM